jgi:hypothetical protein
MFIDEALQRTVSGMAVKALALADSEAPSSMHAKQSETTQGGAAKHSKARNK